PPRQPLRGIRRLTQSLRWSRRHCPDSRLALELHWSGIMKTTALFLLFAPFVAGAAFSAPADDKAPPRSAKDGGVYQIDASHSRSW
ncbi:MAG TPA: hypothetical protein VGD55_04630, partial [Acidothermaceae bacterium]